MVTSHCLFYDGITLDRSESKRSRSWSRSRYFQTGVGVKSESLEIRRLRSPARNVYWYVLSGGCFLLSLDQDIVAVAQSSLNTVKTVREELEKCEGTWSLWLPETAQKAIGHGEPPGLRRGTAEESAEGPLFCKGLFQQRTFVFGHGDERPSGHNEALNEDSATTLTRGATDNISPPLLGATT